MLVNNPKQFLEGLKVYCKARRGGILAFVTRAGPLLLQNADLLFRGSSKHV